jgi:dienelactone hydrolase
MIRHVAISLLIAITCAQGFETMTIPSEDDLPLTVDYYESTGTRGTIVLFHQAGFSRGSYREIAPRLAEAGFASLAVDQRSGNTVNGVANETTKAAISAGKSTQFDDALLDMRAALTYARSIHPNRPVIGWGSSYSSSLILTIAADRPDLVDGSLSFSPGEYFSNSTRIRTAAANVNVPAFITSAKSEVASWSPIFEAIMSPEKVSFVPEVAGSHGSSTLWPTTEGNDAYWVAVEDFLEYWPLSDTGDLMDDNEPREMKLRFTGLCVVEVSSNLEKWSALFYNDDESTLTWSPKSSESLFFRSRAGQENLFDPAHVINVSTNGSAVATVLMSQ